MLIYLSEINKIINTDEISDVNANYNVETSEDFAQVYVNTAMDAKLPIEEQPQDYCTVVLKNKTKIFLNISVEEFWKLIQSKI